MKKQYRIAKHVKYITSVERRFVELLNMGFSPVRAYRMMGYALNEYKSLSLRQYINKVKFFMSFVEKI